jgi:hypothetical protein
MERLALKTPGYDCTNEKGERTMLGGSWNFIVKNGPVAVALSVVTSTDYPETVPHSTQQYGWPAQRHFLTGQVGFHSGVPTSNDQVGRVCPYVPEGRCFGYDADSTMVEEFVPLLSEMFDPQPEALWLRLEDLATEFRAFIVTQHVV